MSDIVRSDYRTADVFKKHGINFCCSGQVTLEDACAAKGLDIQEITGELTVLTRQVSMPNNLRYDTWKIGFLIDYIINVHHAYVTYMLPDLESSLESFVNSHARQFPYLKKVLSVFRELAEYLEKHNQTEENIIFPYIKQIESTYSRREVYGRLFVRTLRKPLASIENEHQEMEDMLTRLRELTDNYTVPGDACTNHHVIFSRLREFDNDLVHHKHLENNILFPRAIELEKELLQL
ncbi:MAG TPA: DUF542 domain-containing protein [Flavisolibacter sp.]